MAGIESRWNPNAKVGSHRGLYQMNPLAWRISGTGLSYDDYVKDPRASTAVVIGELYQKLKEQAFGNNDARFFRAWNANGGLFSSQQINMALQSHRGSKWGEVNLMYANTIQTCAFEMMIGRAAKGYDWIYWYGEWERNYVSTHK